MAAAGFPTNPLEMAPLLIRENELENYLVENESKKQVLKMLEERREKATFAAKAERELNDRLKTETREDIEKFNQKNEILIQYLRTLESSDFALNKLKQSIEKRQEEFYIDLKSMIDKARALNEETKKLQELQAKCDQLRQKTAA